MSETVFETMTDTVNDSTYRLDKSWKEGDLTVTRTANWSAPGCHNGCSLLVYTDKDGKMVGIEGDPNSHYNQGRLCMRCLDMLEAVNHPDRLTMPLKRAGKRGEDKWEEISWDEALDIIAEKTHEIWDQYGPESIACMYGTGRNASWQTPYLCYTAFNSPNQGFGFLSGDSCYIPRMAMTSFLMGDFFIADCSQHLKDRYDDPEYVVPEVMLVWGNNVLASNADGFYGHWVIDVMKRGTKLIVVDPKLTYLASRADCWLPIRPGTDGALALAMLWVVINEDLYDHEFVDKWCYGFDELVERVNDPELGFTPEKAAEVCYLESADIIYEAARKFAAAKPGTIQWGLPVDMHPEGLWTAQSITILGAICGNLDVPGGMMISRWANGVEMAYAFGQWNLDGDSTIEKQIGRMEPAASPLHAAGGSVEYQADMMLKAIETNEPYPVKMAFICTTNPIANMGADAPRVYNAMKKLDFVVVSDVFKTPTCVAFADIILPAAMSVERNSIRGWFWPLRSIVKCVTPPGECKSDEDMVLAVSKRIRPEKVEFDNDIEFMNYFLAAAKRTDVYSQGERSGYGNKWPKPADFTFEDLCDQVINWPDDWSYHKFEKGLLRNDEQPGFGTATGKFECKSTLFEIWGLDPLPHWKEPRESPVSTPQLAEEYPFVLTTGARSYEFFHSEHRQLETMRQFHKWPLVDINPEVAAEYGIEDGDWVWIENMRGRCRQKANLDPALPKWLIRAEHGWWFPEQEAAEPSLFGVFDCNSNNLTPQEQLSETAMGAPYKCQICKIYKDEGDSEMTPTEMVVNFGRSIHE